MPRAKTANPYSVHPGVLMTQTWVQTLPEKTGRSLEEWIRLVQEKGPPTEPERRDWLKEKHGMGHGHANALVIDYLERRGKARH